MDNINYKDFENICRTCLLTCNHTFLQDRVILDVYYKLTETRWDLNDGLPQQICLKCYEKITETHAFSLQCKQAHSSLINCLNQYKNVRIKEAQEIINNTNNGDFNTNIVNEEISDATTNRNDLQDETNITVKNEYFGPDEIEIEEHKVIFVIDENVFDYELQQIKEESIDELKMVPDTDEINNDQNIISVQDDSNENVLNKKISDDSSNENDLQDDTTIDSTSIKKVSNEIHQLLYKCDICPKTFKFKMHLNKHKRKHSVKRFLLCKICNKTFKFISQLNIHTRIHSGERPYACEICNKTFKRSEELKNHKLIQSGERPYACEICNRTFKHSSALITHKRIHSGERPYACEICNKSFIQSCDLTKHKRIHSGERPYACEICNRLFNRSDVLKNHKRTHSGERPYVCEICNKAFKQSNELKNHKVTHSSERPYACEICNRTFKRSYELKSHQRIHSSGHVKSAKKTYNTSKQLNS